MMLKNNKGFSLVELSIVIIIIGLLIASVTVGKDLIDAARLRALIKQLDGIQTQVSTFLLKYDAIPGDIANPHKRGLGPESKKGDGNGIIEDGDGDPDTIDEEISFFWYHLNQAGFTAGAFDGDVSNGVIGETFPKAKHGGGIIAYGISGINYLHIGIGDATGSSPKTTYFTDTFVPEDAFSVDNKIDDGFPLKGHMVARSASCSSSPNTFSCANSPITETNNGASQTAGTTCVLQSGSDQDIDLDEYDFDTNVPKCQLRVLLR